MFSLIVVLGNSFAILAEVSSRERQLDTGIFLKKFLPHVVEV